jgi:hypothetical protein
MNEMELRSLYVDALRAYYGTIEGDSRHREIIDYYNTLKPLPRGYIMTYTADWCVAFTVAVAVKLGLTDIIHPEVSCPEAKKLYQAEGRWVGDRNYVPKPGDFLLFDWNKDGGPNHWSTVVRVEDNTIRTIEGNMGDKVWHRDVQIGDSRILGYCLPDYAKKAAELKPKKKFKDVPENAWYSDSVNRCAELGLMNGISENEFGVGEPVTREQLSAVMVRLYDQLKK